MATTDVMLVATQEWLKNTYGDRVDVPTDGTERAKTIKGLIKALQIELNITADGSWGNNTSNAFDSLFTNGLSQQTEVNTNSTIMHIIYIIQGGFYTARGIAPGGLDGCFGETLTSAIKTFQGQVGINQDGVIKSYLLKAILTTDSYELSSQGDSNIRDIQQSLNNKYYNLIGLIPTNGVYERTTNTAIIKAMQIELQLDVDGIWGKDTMNALPTLRRYATISNKQIAYILQYLLYLNGYNPNGFDGAFGGGVQSAVKACQQDYNLTPDGICGKQTWAALTVSCGDQSRSCTACDTVYEITANRAKVLKNNGYSLVGRYLTNVNGGTLNKRIHEGELETIFNAGLKVFPIYQENGREINNFNFYHGLEDANKAINAAKEYGFPKNTTIFFAVDMDLYEDQIHSNIVPYFRAIKATFDGDSCYKVGVYGSRKLCSILYENKLIEHIFLADASYRFEGNVAKKIPNSWNYDQYSTDVAISDFYIDKVADKGNLIGISELDNSLITNKNESLYGVLKLIYEEAEKYLNTKLGAGNFQIQDINKLVLQALRAKHYDSDLWNITAGILEKNFTDYISNSLGNLDLGRLSIYIEEISNHINIAHLAIVAESFMKNKDFGTIELQKHLVNLSGAVGDLLQMGAKIQGVYDKTSNYNLLSTDIMLLIGCDSDAIPLSYGFDSANATGFDADDFYGDIDGVNIAKLMINDSELKIYDAFRNYYISQASKRFSNYIRTLNITSSISSLSSIENSIKAYVFKYTEIGHELTYLSDDVLVGVFQKRFGNYKTDLWANKLAEGFAKRLASAAYSENN